MAKKKKNEKTKEVEMTERTRGTEATEVVAIEMERAEEEISAASVASTDSAVSGSSDEIMAAETRGKKIAVLIPCYNEALTIAKVVKDFREALPEAEIYVYDNNSTDESAKLAKEAGAIVRFERRQGKGNVVRSMFREIKADCYLMVDADDTYSAADAKRMCEPVLKGEADMVVGDRLSGTYKAENTRRFHNFGNELVRFLINKLFASQVKDIMTGYRAFSYEFVKSFPVLSKGFAVETEMTIHAVDKNFRLTELTIDFKERPEGSSSKLNTYRDGARVLMTIVSLFSEYKPLIFFNILALISLVLAIGFGIPVLSDYFATGLVPKFPSLIVACFMVLAAILFFITSLILNAVTKKHRQLFELYMYQIYSSKEDK